MQNRFYKILMNVFIILLLSLSSCFAGETSIVEYEVSYLRMPILNMTLTWEDRDSTVLISYDNQVKPVIARFHHIHNIYNVLFEKNSYMPLAWSKSVSEGDMIFDLAAQRSADGSSVQYSNQEIRSFPENAFTVFSATHFLASKADEPSFFPTVLKVFIDGEIWEATARRYTRASPHPEIDIADELVLIQADLHYLEGSRVMAENDILMAAIATEGTQFKLWVDADGVYSKAQFGEFPRAVVLEQLTQ